MRCREIEQELSKRHDGMVNSKRERAVSAHLDSCVECREFAASLKKLSGQAATLDIEPSVGIAARSIARWQRDSNPVRASRLGWRAVAAAGCLGGAAVAAWIVAQPNSGRAADPSPLTSLPQAAYSPRVARSASLTPAADLAAPERAATDSRTESGSALPAQIQPSGPAIPASALLPRDDIAYVNHGAAAMPGWWAKLLPDENARLQAGLLRTVKGGDDFVSVPLPRLAGVSTRGLAAAARAWQAEKAVVDPRLIRKLTLAAKGVSFSDLCKQWKEESGIDFSAARTVADDKVTLFCKDKPLRDIMRQITQVFGFLWRRSGEPGQYQYELYQDLRGQLVEEELRNRDRNEALMALDKEMEKYRKFLDLSPEQARAMAQSASPEDRAILEQLGGTGWAGAHLYFGLSGDQMASLRSGGTVDFSSSPDHGQSELPQSMRGSVLQSIPNAHVYRDANGQQGLVMGGNPPPGTTAIPLADLPDAKANANLRLNANDLGQIALEGGAGFGITSGSGEKRSSMAGMMSDTMATGMNPSVRNPDNARANKDLSRDPALSRMVQTDPLARYQVEERRNRPGGARLTSADILEALYKKTGADIVSDYYSRLYRPDESTIVGKTLFDALNRSCDSMRVRWTKADGWLRFRSASYFNDRVKEIPNRLLTRWQQSCKASGMLTMADLIQIASLTDAQLNAVAVGEAVQVIYGLKEWDMAASNQIRPHWRFLANLSPALQAAAMSERGVTFSQLPVGLQQTYISVAIGRAADNIPLQLSDMAGATMRVEFPYPAEKNPDARPAKAITAEREPDVRFSYRFGSPTAGTWTRDIGPRGSSFGHDGNNGRTQEADKLLRGARQ